MALQRLHQEVFVSSAGHAVPSSIAGYPVVRVLGQGGMGRVYLVRHPRVHRLQALKVITAEWGHQEAARERFLREAEIAASVEHPSLVTVYDQDEHDGVLFLAMQWVDGTDLGRLLREGATPGTADVSSGMRQLGDALDVVHRAGLVHRDVKSSNVLVARMLSTDTSPRWVLADFGIARALDESQDLTGQAFIGSVPFAAPERFDGERGSVATDVYALACVAAHALTGRLPFGSSLSSVLGAHARSEPPGHLEGLPHGVADVLRWGMASSPDRRPRSAGAFAAHLGEQLAAAGRPTPRAATARTTPRATAPEPSADDPTVVTAVTAGVPEASAASAAGSSGAPERHGSRRFGRRARWLLAGGAVIVLAGGAAVWWLPSRPADAGSPPWTFPPISAASIDERLADEWNAGAEGRGPCPLLFSSVSDSTPRVPGGAALETYGEGHSDYGWSIFMSMPDEDGQETTFSLWGWPRRVDAADAQLPETLGAWRYDDGTLVTFGPIPSNKKYLSAGIWPEATQDCTYEVQTKADAEDLRIFVDSLRMVDTSAPAASP